MLERNYKQTVQNAAHMPKIHSSKHCALCHMFPDSCLQALLLCIASHATGGRSVHDAQLPRHILKLCHHKQRDIAVHATIKHDLCVARRETTDT